jgi:hypothetical protein
MTKFYRRLWFGELLLAIVFSTVGFYMIYYAYFITRFPNNFGPETGILFGIGEGILLCVPIIHNLENKADEAEKKLEAKNNQAPVTLS